jgi:hypothetical protein
MKHVRDVTGHPGQRNELRLPRDREQLLAMRESEGTLPVIDRAKVLAQAEELQRLVAPSEARALIDDIMMSVLRRQISVEQSFARVEMALEHARAAMEEAKRNLEHLRGSWRDTNSK